MKAKAHMLKTFSVCSGVFSALVSCGTETGNPTRPQPNVNLETAQSIVGVEADEALSLLADSTGATEAFALAENGYEMKRTCATQNDGSLSVTIVGEGQRSNTWSRGKWAIQSVFQGAGSQNQVWKLPGVDLECRDLLKRPKINWLSQLLGLEVTNLVSRSRTVERTAENATTAEKRVAKNQLSKEGVMTSTITAEDFTPNSNFSRATSYEFEFTRKNKVENAEGIDIELDATTKSENSIVIEVTRNKQNYALVSKRFVSGSVLTTYKNEMKARVTFENIVATTGCAPSSGKLTVQVFENGSDVLGKAYSINFSNGEAAVTGADGTSFDYFPSGCDPEDE